MYALNGWVNDTAGRPVEGARVEVLSGPQTGASALTNRDGEFAFTESFAAVPEMRSSKAGYRQDRSDVFVFTASSIRGLFRLGSLNPPVDFGGAYELTFIADPACTALPAEARVRRYQTTLDDSDHTFQLLTLSGASFARPNGGYAWNAIYLQAYENFVNLNFSDPAVWELLDGPASVYIEGAAAGVISGSSTELRLTGEFEFCGATITAGAGECEQERSCKSSNHTLTLTRR